MARADQAGDDKVTAVHVFDRVRPVGAGFGAGAVAAAQRSDALDRKEYLLPVVRRAGPAG